MKIMNFSIKQILLGVIVFVGIAFVLDLARFFVLVRKGWTLAEQAVPFERALTQTPMKILVLGDSTAVGTGSEKPEVSTAGRLGNAYPKASVTNMGINGLKLKGLAEMLPQIKNLGHFDIILVQIGANDIIRLTKMDNLRKEADQVLAELTPLADKLIVLHSGDVGNSRLFPLYLRPTLSKRSYAVRKTYKELAAKYGFLYVDLIASPSDKLLDEDPKRYYAADFLHLNGEGYGLWFDEIKKVLE